MMLKYSLTGKLLEAWGQPGYRAGRRSRMSTASVSMRRAPSMRLSRRQPHAEVHAEGRRRQSQARRRAATLARVSLESLRDSRGRL
jgi:hypothetical protein